MRSEAEMFALILGFAKNDPRVRLVGMVGSRANPNAPRDDFQDFDITYLVNDFGTFTHEENWLEYFGKRIITQKPDEMGSPPLNAGQQRVYLMLFEDGNRIDLTILPVERLEEYRSEDRMMKILLDKDQRVPDPPTPTDMDYWLKPPTAKLFDDCCNEFWWVCPYVVKGLCRNEFLYAAAHLEGVLRTELLKMLAWKVGCTYGFNRSLGKQYKYMQRFLSQQDWKALMRTYRLNNPNQFWKAFFATQLLFRRTTEFVAKKMGYSYPDYDAKVSVYIRQAYELFQKEQCPSQHNSVN